MQTFCGQCGERLVLRAPSGSDAQLCTVLDGRFFIESKIASGGFGTVYRARSLETKQEVAIKVLHPQHSSDPAVSARFHREGIALSSLACPHTVTTSEIGEAADGTRFMVMELLHGESLAERFLARGVLHWRTVLTIVRSVCESLAEAHKLGIVHRDLKPANIFLCKPNDFVKVLDFGIAKILDGSNLRDGADLTRIGQAIGTLEYMSPEQLIGGELDNRTDIYTLGVVAYEMIAGKRPFADATGATALVTALMTQRPIPLSTLVRGSLPSALDGVLLRCLEREASDRYASVQELAQAIDEMLAKDDLNTTMRQWNKQPATKPARATPRAQVVFECEPDDELTQVDVKPPFPLKPDSKPPLDSIPDAFAGGDITPSPQLPEVRFDDVVRTQLTDGRSPRVRAQGTNVPANDSSPFDFSDAGGTGLTGARPLVATRYSIGRASTEPAGPREFPLGSSPVIGDGAGTWPAPRESVAVVVLPPAPAPRISGAQIVLWATGLAVLGLGIGVVVSLVAG